MTASDSLEALLTRLCSALASGAEGTSLISIYAPAGSGATALGPKLRSEMSAASNIKSRV
jgi:peptide subunit release factor 1 (eRF1)